jgi:hypothetical protein
MRLNISKGLFARMSLCVGIVLLLVFFASVAPGAAVTKKICKETCTKCVVEDSEEWECHLDHKCVAICRVFREGKMQTVYACFERECCMKEKYKTCTPQSLCTTNNQCIQGKAEDKLCTTLQTCSRWSNYGISYGNCDQCDRDS